MKENDLYKLLGLVEALREDTLKEAGIEPESWSAALFDPLDSRDSEDSCPELRERLSLLESFIDLVSELDITPEEEEAITPLSAQETLEAIKEAREKRDRAPTTMPTMDLSELQKLVDQLEPSTPQKWVPVTWDPYDNTTTGGNTYTVSNPVYNTATNSIQHNGVQHNMDYSKSSGGFDWNGEAGRQFRDAMQASAELGKNGTFPASPKQAIDKTRPKSK